MLTHPRGTTGLRHHRPLPPAIAAIGATAAVSHLQTTPPGRLNVSLPLAFFAVLEFCAC